MTRPGADMTFWQVFLILLIFLPLVMLWVFALVDLFLRPELSGIAKALWAIAILFLPLIGMLVYFIVRDPQPASAGSESADVPPAKTAESRVEQAESEVGAVAVADQLERLADLRDKSILTDDEFQREKDKLLSPGAS